MTVITMSRTEIDRMSVLRDLTEGRIKVTAASTLMGLAGVKCFGWRRLTDDTALKRWYPAAAAGRATGAIRARGVSKSSALSGSVTRTSARRWRRRSWPSCTVFTLDARRYGNG